MQPMDVNSDESTAASGGTPTDGQGAPPRGSAGMTLVELMIVVGLLGLLFTVALPSFRDYLRGRDTRSAAVAVQVAVNVAKSHAATTNRRVVLDFSPGGLSTGDGFYTAYDDLDGDGVPSAAEVDTLRLPTRAANAGIAGWRLPDGVEFGPPAGASAGPLGVPVSPDGVTFTDDRITVRPDGTAGEAGHIALRDPDGRGWAITLTAGGAVRIYHFDGSGWR